MDSGTGVGLLINYERKSRQNGMTKIYYTFKPCIQFSTDRSCNTASTIYDIS